MTILNSAPSAHIYQDNIPMLKRNIRYRIGLVALSTDHTLERDIVRLIPHDVAAIYTSRVEFINPVTPENLRRMQPHIARAAELLLTDQPIDAICYACTSASATLGDEPVLEALAKGKPNTPATNPALAGVAAIKALDAKNVSVITPYPPETSQKLADYFVQHGCNITQHTCLNIDDDRQIAHINPEALVDITCQSISHDADAVFLSCTALPAVSIINELEEKLGKPVITSNQAMLWMALRLAGCGTESNGGQNPNGGKLFTLNLT